jgi:hypothetical protein
MNQQKEPSTTLGLQFKILAAFIGIFFLGRFSYVNNTVNHDQWVGLGIVGVAVTLYLIVALGVRGHNQRISNRVLKVSDELGDRAAKIQRDLDKGSRKDDA